MDESGVTWPSPRFTNNGNATVTDQLTGLMWSHEPNLLGSTKYKYFDKDDVSGDGLVTWQRALDFIKTLNSDYFAGYNDWRLPNINELVSLRDASIAGSAGSGFDPTEFLFGAAANAIYGSYWSSTTSKSATTRAWMWAAFSKSSSGMNSFAEKSQYFGVFPVRGGRNSGLGLSITGQKLCYDTAGTTINCSGTGQDGELQKGIPWEFFDRYIFNNDLFSLDKYTDLIWSPPPSATSTWQQALDAAKQANQQSLGGYSDWRLPNSIEILTNFLSPYDAPHEISAYLWTSTTNNGNKSAAWESIFFPGGALIGSNKDGTQIPGSVMLVRGGSVTTQNRIASSFSSGTWSATNNSAAISIGSDGKISSLSINFGAVPTTYCRWGTGISGKDCSANTKTLSVINADTSKIVYAGDAFSLTNTIPAETGSVPKKFFTYDISGSFSGNSLDLVVNVTYSFYDYAQYPSSYSAYSWAETGSKALQIAMSNGVASNGVCGSSNGSAFTTAPAANLCSTGSASAVTGTGPWYWTCAGLSGGASQSCSATVQGASTFALSVSKSGTGSGTITSSPAGINCGTTCSASFNNGTSVTLTAAPATGSSFTGWSGACSGTSTCVVSMSAAQNITASFTATPIPYTLSVTKSGTGSGTITSAPAGINCGTTCSASFNSGTSVTLTAIPAAAGSTFTGWSGACTGIGSCVVTLDATKTVTANFNPTPNITSGLVAYYPFNGNANDESGNNNNGTVYGAILTTDRFGNANRAYSFDGVSGFVSVTSSPVFDILAGVSYSAWVRPRILPITGSFILNKWVDGQEDKQIGLASDGRIYFYMYNCMFNSTLYSVSAIALNKWTNITGVYDGVSAKLYIDGLLSSQVNTNSACEVSNNLGMFYIGDNPERRHEGNVPFSGEIDEVMIYNKALTANEVLSMLNTGATASFTLRISHSGSGVGTVTSIPAGINCGTTCSASFDSGTSVTLTATPATGSTFTGWSGACSGTSTCVVSMSAAQNVTATFALSVSAPVCTLSASPATITAGGSTTLTATCTPAATSYTWTGGTCASTSASCTVTPTATTAYTVAGTNTVGTGAATSTTVTVTPTGGALQPNADGTVTDPKTGLIWMRCAMGANWNGSTCSGTGNTYTFDQANALTGTVTFAGQSDWRMPNIRELQTIVDRSVYSPTINSAAFPNTPSSYFWSGSPYSSLATYAWGINFDYGFANGYSPRSDLYVVRLVRGGQSFGSLLSITRPTSDYVDNGNGTVTHTPTKLMWKRCAEGQDWTGSTCGGTASSMTADQAEALSGTFVGQSDWRLPTADELVSLVDYSRYDPAINISIFPATPSSIFWSGSPNVSNSSYAWVVGFFNGYASSGSTGLRSNNYAVRLVRTVQSSAPVPVCTLNANPATITAGSSSTLTATCTPAATSYTWTGGTCAGTTGSTCTVAPTTTTPYTVAGTNTSGTGTAASATVTVNPCTYTLVTSSASVAATASTGSVSVSVTSSCAWTATSNTSWISISSGASGSGNGTVTYAVTANTGTTERTGTLTIAGQTFTVTQQAGSGGAPVCTLSASPASITAGGSSTLTATCTPAATSYIWTGGTCASTSATCTVKPTMTTAYSVQGINTSGAYQAVSTTVTVTPNITSYTVPGTLGNDVFVLTAGNSYYGGAGNDTYISSSSTLHGDVTAKIVDTEGDNVIQLVDGLTIAVSAFYTDAAQLTLSSGAKVQILGASKFKFQVGANALAGDTAAVLTYTEFATSLGASLSGGTLPASGTAGYVVPTGFTQASAPVPSVASSSYTVPGTLSDDVLAPSGGNNYLGGGSNDTYILSPYTLSGAVTAKIIDSEGTDVIQLVNGLTIASSSFFNNAVQLTLSNGATVQILGASHFSYQLGANAPAGETAASLTFAQFAASLGASVPATGGAAVSGSANFVVQNSGHP
ncbi:MAG: DUF1566 domain-containing protein [Rhodoferax sp.]|nr:DUF1566 domain-containing protein [Rhodoferax sp.]